MKIRQDFQVVFILMETSEESISSISYKNSNEIRDDCWEIEITKKLYSIWKLKINTRVLCHINWLHLLIGSKLLSHTNQWYLLSILDNNKLIWMYLLSSRMDHISFQLSITLQTRASSFYIKFIEFWLTTP